MQTVILWPNTDAGSEAISKSFRLMREQNKLNLKKVRFFKDIPHTEYFNLLKFVHVSLAIHQVQSEKVHLLECQQ